jgi:hypothetical protein
MHALPASVPYPWSARTRPRVGPQPFPSGDRCRWPAAAAAGVRRGCNSAKRVVVMEEGGWEGGLAACQAGRRRC